MLHYMVYRAENSETGLQNWGGILKTPSTHDIRLDF